MHGDGMDKRPRREPVPRSAAAQEGTGILIGEV